MQVYRGMDIGTAKMKPEDRKVHHHGIDLCEPNEDFSAALFQDYARSCFSALDRNGKRAVLCGGTGLYVRAAIDDYRFVRGGQRDNGIREHYARIAQEQGTDRLWALLNEKDAASAALIHPHNTRRIIRAFEMLAEGSSYAQQHACLKNIPQFVPAHFLGLEVEPGILNRRIDERVDAMIAEGLVDEVMGLLDRGFRESITAPQAIGYKEIVAALDGDCSLDEAVMRIKRTSHRYAKRQRSWFRGDSRIRWLRADSGNITELLSLALHELDTMDEAGF
jgi:tRNA dimethylallyltransferase